MLSCRTTEGSPQLAILTERGLRTLNLQESSTLLGADPAHAEGTVTTDSFDQGSLLPTLSGYQIQ
jgi:hypothetical protein